MSSVFPIPKVFYFSVVGMFVCLSFLCVFVWFSLVGNGVRKVHVTRIFFFPFLVVQYT